MVSPELIRRYEFFANLSHDYIVFLAKSAEEFTVDAEHYFFKEDEILDKFYLVLEGAVAIVMQVPDRSVVQDVSGQLTGDIMTKDVTVSTIGTGNVFGWSGLVQPYHTTAGAKAITRCRGIAFDCVALRKQFDDDGTYGYLMIQKAAQILRDRLRDIRIESLAELVS